MRYNLMMKSLFTLDSLISLYCQEEERKSVKYCESRIILKLPFPLQSVGHMREHLSLQLE